MTEATGAAAPVYVIVGGAGGIGSELASQLAEDGARLVITSRSEPRARTVADRFGAQALALDPADFASVEQTLVAVRDGHGRLDGVANCAGSILLKPAHLTTADEWNEVLRANLHSSFAVVRAAGKAMRGGGSVVLVASAAASIGLSSHEAVAAAKAGVAGLTRAAAATYAARSLRFNAVAPGLVRTPATERITSSQRASEASRSMHALGRLGEPADIASAIRWLLDPQQSWVTGQVLGVDGGLAGVRTSQPAKS
jgi:NAD(P)-dependent dehydrogenase (short-subunit alcohol dehydrogenase family)